MDRLIESALKNFDDELRTLLEPFGWQIERITMSPSLGSTIRYHFSLRIGHPRDPNAKRIAIEKPLDDREMMMCRDIRQVLKHKPMQWAREIMSQSLNFIAQENTLPDAPDPPDWRPGEMMPEDYYAR